MNKLGLTSSSYFDLFCLKKDSSRITVMDRKSSDATKKSRKKVSDKDVEKEGVTYGAGLF